MASFGIVGMGRVGKAFRKMVETVDYYDITGLGSKDSVNRCDIGVVCVPTPSLPSGECDTSIVEEVVSWLETPVILIKSTVPPGTCDMLSKRYGKRIVFSPEYVGETSYYLPPKIAFNDMADVPFVIVGGENRDCNEVIDALLPILGATKRYFKCSARDAELIKYMENTFFAVKVTFAREMKGIADAMGIDWYTVWQGWALDPRVDPMHTAVFPDKPGFRGKCLPKDTAALIHAARAEGYHPHMLAAMIESNEQVTDGNA